MGVPRIPALKTCYTVVGEFNIFFVYFWCTVVLACGKAQMGRQAVGFWLGQVPCRLHPANSGLHGFNLQCHGFYDSGKRSVHCIKVRGFEEEGNCRADRS